MRVRASLSVGTLLGVLGCGASDDDGVASGAGGASASVGSTTTSTGVGAGPSGAIDGAITRYLYAFDLTTGQARSSLDVSVKTPGDCYATKCELPVTGVKWNDSPASKSSVENGALSACGHGIDAGKTLALAADVSVVEQTFLGLDVGFSRRKNLAGGQFSYLLSWVGGCDRFGPCDDEPSRLASFRFEVKHGPADVVLCPGVLTKSDTKTICELSGTLAPTYSAFAIAADPQWQKSKLLAVAGVDLVMYEVPQGAIAKTLDANSVGEFMTWITSLLGAFPYGSELRVAAGPTKWLGFEHPANIVLYENLPKFKSAYANATMHVLMHEIVHQWAGDRTTLASAADFVWKEAIAEYLSYVFEDERRPMGEAAASLTYWDGISLQSKHHPRPTDDPPPAVHTFYGDVYGPGPLVLFIQLESMLGRKIVLDGIKKFLSEPGAKSVADLKAALESASGKSLTAYFDSWVFGIGVPEWPTFAIKHEQVGDQVKVTVTQENASKKLYGCAVEVEIAGASKKAVATVDFGLEPKSASASTTITFAEQVTGTSLDPRHRLVGRLAGGSGNAVEPILPVWPL
jgi:aminopeptidase N